MKIMRYRLVPDSTMGPYHIGDHDGPWVKWDDVQAALAEHEARMAAMPTFPRPSSPAEGLRALALWFSALYPGEDCYVAQDLCAWADEFEALLAEAQGGEHE